MISVNIPPFQDWYNNLYLFIVGCNESINSTDDSIFLWDCSFCDGVKDVHSSCCSNLESSCTPTTSLSSILNVTIPKLTVSDTDEKTPSKFPCFEIQKGVSNNIHVLYYTTEDAYDVVDI